MGCSNDSRRTYMRKIEEWGIDKKVKTEEMKAVYSKVARRLAEGPGPIGKDTEITVRGIKIEKQQLKRFMERQLERAESERDKVEAQGMAATLTSVSTFQVTATFSSSYQPASSLRANQQPRYHGAHAKKNGATYMSPFWGVWPAGS